MLGHGIYRKPHGDHFEGTYFNDKRDGFGIELYSDGTRYEGIWKNGIKEGKGNFYKKDFMEY